MSYKHVGTAGDLVRFGCSLKVECTGGGAKLVVAQPQSAKMQVVTNTDRIAPSPL